MEPNIVAEGLKFMILGMGIVFVFLYFMILVLKFQAKLIAKYFPDKKIPTTPQKTQTDTPDTSDKSKKVAAAIAAIAHHKNSTR